MKEVKLVVADARKRDIGRGITRIDEKSRNQIGVRPGDIVEILGKKRTVAIVWPAYKGDKDKGIVRIDSFIRKNAGLILSEEALIRSVEVENAQKVKLAPVDMRLNVDSDFENFVKNRLMEHVFLEGDLFVVSMLEHLIPFRAVRTIPRKVPVRVTVDTDLSIFNEPFPPLERIPKNHVDIKYLLRIDWLNHLNARIQANTTIFSIPDYGISNTEEQKVIDSALKIADENLSNVRVDVTFQSNETKIGTLQWAEVDPYGRVSAIYPDIQLPPLSPAFVPQTTHEKVFPPMRRCFKTGVRNCPKKIDFSPRSVVVAMPFKDAYTYAVRPALEESGFKVWKADEQISNIDIMCKICQAIQESGYVIANITDWNPNVVFELGLSYGLAKNVILIKHKKAEVPVDLKGLEYIEYSTIEELKRNLLLFLKGASTTTR